MHLIRQVGKSNVPWGLRVWELPLLLEEIKAAVMRMNKNMFGDIKTEKK